MLPNRINALYKLDKARNTCIRLSITTEADIEIT